ncbi:hypothetical protein V6Z11_A07G263700 [Gossypium hirsutum]
MLQGTNNASKQSRIRNKRSFSSCQTISGCHGCRGVVRLVHGSPFKKIQDILPLTKKNPIRSITELNTEKVTQPTKIFKRKLDIKLLQKLIYSLRICPGDYYVIDIDKEIE